MPSIVSTMVEVCVVRFPADRPEYLMLRRAADEQVYPGIWQMVTGSLHPGERALAAGLRELREETGFVPDRLWVVPWANTFYDRRRDAIQITPMFAAQVGASAGPVLSDEHDAFAWMLFRDALRRLVWPGQRRGLEIVHQYIVAGEPASGLGEVPPGEWE